MILSISTFEFLNQLKQEAETFSDLQDLSAQLISNPEKYPFFKLYNGAIYPEARPVINKLSPLRNFFLKNFIVPLTCWRSLQFLY